MCHLVNHTVAQESLLLQYFISVFLYTSHLQYFLKCNYHKKGDWLFLWFLMLFLLYFVCIDLLSQEGLDKIQTASSAITNAVFIFKCKRIYWHDHNQIMHCPKHYMNSDIELTICTKSFMHSISQKFGNAWMRKCVQTCDWYCM